MRGTALDRFSFDYHNARLSTDPDCDRNAPRASRSSSLSLSHPSPTLGGPSAIASSRIASSRARSSAIRASRASACRRRSANIADVFASNAASAALRSAKTASASAARFAAARLARSSWRMASASISARAMAMGSRRGSSSSSPSSTAAGAGPLRLLRLEVPPPLLTSDPAFPAFPDSSRPGFDSFVGSFASSATSRRPSSSTPHSVSMTFAAFDSDSVNTNA
mmetsp:Transcript_5663/g.23342  ORF Transcript_5663/g.23342 Transcript_5663/m.23342 type:complete len:223 (-) Transcript_5663:731-1399(-)